MSALKAYFRCPHCKTLNIRMIKKSHLFMVTNCEICGKKIDLSKIKVKYTVQNFGR